jgi:hypothetical protein
MRPEPDITRIVESWLLEGTDRLPDRVLDSVLERVPATPQRRPAWSVRRLSQMTTLYRGAALAAVLVVALVAGIYFIPIGGAGGSGGAPSPTPSPTPVALSADQTVPAGTYAASSFAHPFSITFSSAMVPKVLSAGAAEFIGASSSGEPWIQVHAIDGVYADPCHTEVGPVGSPTISSVDGLVAALSGMTGFTVTDVTDVNVGSRPAKQLTLSNSIDTATAGCTNGPMLPLWHVQGWRDASTNGGTEEHIWVVEVDGSPVVIDAGPASAPASLQEVTKIVESISFK